MQQTLMTLAVRVSTLVAAFDRVAADADAMAEAATQFQDILQVPCTAMQSRLRMSHCAFVTSLKCCTCYGEVSLAKIMRFKRCFACV